MRLVEPANWNVTACGRGLRTAEGERHAGTPQADAVIGRAAGRGFRVALVTDARMSGASGKVPAAIQVCPEALAGGAIGKIQNGDMVTVDTEGGVLSVAVDDAVMAERRAPEFDPETVGFGRELFGGSRRECNDAETGLVRFRWGGEGKRKKEVEPWGGTELHGDERKAIC